MKYQINLQCYKENILTTDTYEICILTIDIFRRYKNVFPVVFQVYSSVHVNTNISEERFLYRHSRIAFVGIDQSHFSTS